MVVHSDKLKLFDGEPPKSWLVPGYDSDIDAVDMMSKSDEESKQSDQAEIDEDRVSTDDSTERKRPARSKKRPAWLKEFITEQYK